LAVLKLIDAKFFLSSTWSVEAHAAYLTYFCYMVLGSLVAVFLSDHELPTPKVRRSAFVLGLLAPSVLLAIANQQIRLGGDKSETAKMIPSISLGLVSSAYAQVKPEVAEERAILVQKGVIEPTFWDAVGAAVGRKELKEKYAYVLGTTPDEGKAIDTAEKLGALLKQAKLRAQVYKLEKTPNYFVVVGGFGDHGEALLAKNHAIAAAIRSVYSESKGREPSTEKKKLADLVVNAPVIPARQLAQGGK